MESAFWARSWSSNPGSPRDQSLSLWEKVRVHPQAILRAGASFDHWQLCDSWLGLEIRFAATEESKANWVTWGSNLSPSLQPDELNLNLPATDVAVEGQHEAEWPNSQPLGHYSKSVKPSTDFWNRIRQVFRKRGLQPIWMEISVNREGKCGWSGPP